MCPEPAEKAGEGPAAEAGESADGASAGDGKCSELSEDSGSDSIPDAEFERRCGTEQRNTEESSGPIENLFEGSESDGDCSSHGHGR